MKKMIFGSIAVFIIYFFSSGISLAANIYVDNTLASDCSSGDYSIKNRDSSGSDGDAYRTVAGAIAAMSSGDDIYIRGGTYNEGDLAITTSIDGTSENYTSFQSYPGEWAVIDAQRSAGTGPYDRNVFTLNKYVEYVRFERLEITGGGYTGSGDYFGAGIGCFGGDCSFIIIRYCYIHDNLCPTADENPAGIGFRRAKYCTIEYNYLYYNGSTSGDLGNCSAIEFISDYGAGDDRTGFDIDNATHSNIVRYNFIDQNGYGTGIKNKNQQPLSSSDPSGTAYETYGDKWHHNIIIGVNRDGIDSQQDFAQIYNNIIDFESFDSSAVTTKGIAVKKYGSEEELFYVTVYNNLVINSGEQGIGHSGESGDTAYAPYVYIYNNIVRGNKDYNAYYPGKAFYLGIDTDTVRASIDMSHAFVDANYVYEPSGSDHYALGDNAGDRAITTTEFNTAYSTSNSVSSEPGMFAGESGSDRYMPNPEWDDYATVSSGGIHRTHPYLSGVTIPSYIGATNPNDNRWVDGVLNDVASTAWLRVQGDGAPGWIEGSSAPNKVQNVRVLYPDGSD